MLNHKGARSLWNSSIGIHGATIRRRTERIVSTMKGSTIGIRGKIVLTSALIAVLGVASVAVWLTVLAAAGLTTTAKQGLATAAHQEAEHVNGEFARAL